MEIMYKDGFDVVTDVRSLINIPSILALLGTGGKVDPSIKTTGSDKKGIVVNSIGITNTKEQKGLGNINCYSPAIISKINGKNVSLPDQQALSTLVKVVKPLVDGVRMSHFECWVSEQATIVQDTDGSYFANLPFEYRASQNGFKNI